jgi:hypothetical protein
MVGLRFMSDCGRDMLQERYRELLQLVQCRVKFVSLNFGEICFLYCRLTNLPVSAGTFLKSGILVNGRYPWLGNQVMFSGCLYHYYCVHTRLQKYIILVDETIISSGKHGQNPEKVHLSFVGIIITSDLNVANGNLALSSASLRRIWRRHEMTLQPRISVYNGAMNQSSPSPHHLS